MEMWITCSSLIGFTPPPPCFASVQIKGKIYRAWQEQKVVQYKKLCLEFRLPVKETKRSLKGVTSTLIRWQSTKEPPNYSIFNIYLSPLYRVSHRPPPPLHSQHAYNCCPLKFNLAPCSTSTTPPIPQTTPLTFSYSHTLLPQSSFWMIQPPLWSSPAPSECPLKPTGLAKSRPQTRYPERRQDEKKNLLFEVCEKVDGLFHDRPSFKCMLWRRPWKW